MEAMLSGGPRVLCWNEERRSSAFFTVLLPESV
jgi:hypothetical protein